MTNLGIVVHLVAMHASRQLERLQDGMTETTQVSENAQAQKDEVAMDLRDPYESLREFSIQHP
jgi:hypothetical protein